MIFISTYSKRKKRENKKTFKIIFPIDGDVDFLFPNGLQPNTTAIHNANEIPIRIFFVATITSVQSHKSTRKKSWLYLEPTTYKFKRSSGCRNASYTKTGNENKEYT